MTRFLSAIAALLALLYLAIGLRWLLDPAGAAASLGMPLLEGAGRSTQIGDFASFFLTGGGLAAAGVVLRRPSLLVATGVLLGLAACCRTLAWALHDAPFAAASIVVEMVTLVVMMLTARSLAQPAEPSAD